MTYASHIAAATVRFMERDPKALVIGAGVTDVKGIFNTTKPAHKKFPDRVIESPLSETMLTNACVGLAENGYHPVFVHARMDFATLSVEALVNTAAKHNFLFGKTPMMMRAIIGQGWGNGPNHTQNFAHWFANIPGLDVHMPVTRGGIDAAFDSLAQGNTVVMIEHRRLYDTDLKFAHAWPSHKTSLNIYPVSASAIDAEQAAFFLRHKHDVLANVWPVQHLNALPIHDEWVKGKPAIVIDCNPQAYGPSAEIAARLYDSGASRVVRLSPPPYPCPASAPLEASWYPSVADVVNAGLELTGSEERMDSKRENHVPEGAGAF